MKARTRKNPRKAIPADPDYIKLTKEPGGSVVSQVNWTFDSPHKAGHAVGSLIRAIIVSIQKLEPRIDRETLYREMISGIDCKVSDEFLEGGADEFSIRVH